MDPAPLGAVDGPSDDECSAADLDAVLRTPQPSDDESSAADLDAVLSVPRRLRVRRASSGNLDDPTVLRATLGKPCGCKIRGGCVTQFQRHSDFEELRRFREELKSLHKLDQDRVVHDQLRQQLSSDESAWTFLGKPVCLKAWENLLSDAGLVHVRLWEVQQIESICSTGMDHTASVVSYLMEIYHSVAETLPDFRDETLDVETSLVAGDGEDKDFYSDLLAAQQALGPGPENPKSSSSSKPKNPKHRKMRKSIKVNLARKPETGGLYEDKWLPPGQMKDHWELYRRCQRGHECVWLREFPFLKVRGLRQHPECSTCVKHKCLLRSLSGHIYARQKQQQAYHNHLHSQYRDRLQYWGHRGMSRSRGTELVIICDGMDQSKFCFPRHKIMKSKDFASFQRPRCHVVGMILHGRAILFAISDADLPKDASTHCELLAHALTWISSMEDLANLSVTLQCDNTPRECKNNVMLAFLASLVAKGIIRESGLSSLRSGHSHEDIDQVFGRLSSFMVRHGHGSQTTEDFRALIERFLKEAEFPFEPPARRRCIKLDQTRDWPLTTATLALLSSRPSY
ncbi:unnamed protein product [Cladocopium goreaui]|uniref:DUF7869 domain-containing protein n=1 Tax=Cladocopium goreaui TaxID=2562237 RepID=A0A9P1FG46_9DINO|nr:unnamed protein product [Cladocopium goreaui]